MAIPQSFTYPGAVWPNVNPPPPSVLSSANAFPNLAFPQHLSGRTNTVKSFLYSGAVQPAAVLVFYTIRRQVRLNILQTGP